MPKLVALLRQLAEQDGVADDASAGGERDAADHCVEQRRLAAAVRPDDRQAVGPPELKVERPEPERPALDDGALEPGDDIAAPTLRSVG